MNKRSKKFLEAVARGDVSRVKKHLEREGQADLARDQHDRTALMLAVDLGHVAVVRALLEAGADPTLSTSKVSPWRSVVDRSPLMVEVLAKAVDVNAPLDEFGNTPLMLAAREYQAEIVALLLEFGADPSARTPRGTTAVDWAEDEPEDVIPGEESCPHWRQATIDVLKEAMEAGGALPRERVAALLPEWGRSTQWD